MAKSEVAFVGSIPENYERYLASIFFNEYADDLAARLPVTPGTRVLEVACGTGILTRRLLARLADAGTLVATDLNEAMVAHARARVPGRTGLEWQQADGTNLPFPDRSFDAVVCQFGLMFFPDKAAGVREALRVLRPGGLYLFNTWDAIERNPIARIAHETAAGFFPTDPPRFYTLPFGLHAPATVVALLDAAGFADVQWRHVEKVGTSPTAAEAATGLVEGTPLSVAIKERRPEALAEITAAVARNVAAELGNRPVRSPLRALVCSARRGGS